MIETLVLFDCDGVLVDSEIIACRIEAEELTSIGYPLSTEECIRLFAGKSQKAVRETVELALGKPVPKDFEAMRHARILRALEDSLQPVPGIAQTLDRIALKCVASSGTPDKIDTNLRVTGLEKHFPPAVRFSAVHVQSGKPAPDLFLHASARMNVPVSRCIVVEDSVYGVQGAKAAGMKAFGFTGGSHIPNRNRAEDLLYESGADLVFDDMGNLPYLLSLNGFSDSLHAAG